LMIHMIEPVYDEATPMDRIHDTGSPRFWHKGG
jgi:hypothetical protein